MRNQGPMVRLPTEKTHPIPRPKCRWDSQESDTAPSLVTTAPGVQVVDTVILYERTDDRSSLPDIPKHINREDLLRAFVLTASISGLLLVGFVLLEMLLQR